MNARRTALLAGPLAFLLLLFLVPLAAVLRAGLADGPTALWGTLVASSTWRILGFTVLQAGLSTVATFVVAMPAAYVLAVYRFPGRSVLRALVLVPFVMPTVVVGAAFLALLGPTGLLGIDLSGSLWGLVLAHMFRTRTSSPPPGSWAIPAGRPSPV
ncbi:MAG: hypothetical protein MUE31_08625 [Candidatus Nanopelagicales bacterium]|nr:hypothetical protein [Candidatus Nanopelagicales bacterium]